jgi:putative transposase
MVDRAEHYVWSSAVAHVTGRDPTGLLDMDWWRLAGRENWRQALNRRFAQCDEEAEEVERQRIRSCTYAGRPFGDPAFVADMAKRFQRYWNRGRPSQHRASDFSRQFPLFPTPPKSTL